MWLGTVREWLASRHNFCPDKFFHHSDNFILLGMRKLGEHRQGNDLTGNPFCYRKIACLIAKVLIGFLLMERNWIMNASTNPGLSQTGLQPFSVLHPDDIEVIDTLRPSGFQWENYHVLNVRK